MVTLREATARFISCLRSDARDREFDQELASHIEMATTDHLREGLSPEDARRRALARLGGVEPAKQLHRESRGLPSLDAFLQDVRYGWRTLRRQPAFTATAVATLAIGIGATTAIFSTVNATLLRPLPYPPADRLVDVHTRYIDGRVTTGMVAPVEIASLKNLSSVTEAVAGFSGNAFDATLIRSDGAPVSVVSTGITEGFFELFGIPPALGRTFTAAEHAAVSGGSMPPPVAILSHRLWAAQFTSDPAIVGSSIRLAEFGSLPVTVVGIAAPGFDFPRATDVWVNLRLNPGDSSHNFGAVVRLQPGATMDQLRSAANVALVELGNTVPNNVGREYVLRSFLSSVVGDLRPILLIVLGATALLLILACVNVTNLLLARGTSQAHEVAMRAALGASRGRVVSQLLAQSMVLATGGAIAGLAFAYGAVRLLLVLGASQLPRLETVPFDWRVLSFSLVVLVTCGLAMGIVPAVRLAVTDIKTVLNEGGRRATPAPGTSRLMSGLIVAEVALAIALVAGAGWLMQSFTRLRATDPGFVAAGRVLVDVRPTRAFRNPAEVRTWSNALLQRVQAAAGTARVGAAATFPFGVDRDGTTNIEMRDEAPDPSHVRSGRMRVVTPGFFEAMGVRLVSGRTFTTDDRQDVQRTTVVNRAFVRRYFPNGDAIGGTFAIGFPTPDREHMLQVVGIVDDVRYKSLGEEGEATFYMSQEQAPWPLVRHAIVAASPDGRLDALTATLRDELRRFDPQLIVAFTPMSQLVADTLERQALGMTLMMVFGATAIALAAIGLYGVIAYAAAQRRPELATRIALGASRQQVFWLMMGGGQRLMLIGLALGLGLAYAAGRLLASSVFAMRAADPVVLLSAGLVVALVTWAATIIPALRASRQDPLRTLRSE